MSRVFLTGPPGVGKTTLIMHAVERLPGEAVGFVTGELRSAGRRVGFELRTLEGKTATLAHVERQGPPRIGRYGVNLEALELLGAAEIERAVALGVAVVIDEVGPMELLSKRFRQSVVSALASDLPILGTVMGRPHPFADRIKNREDVEILVVSQSNRDQLLEGLIARFAT